jgi:two-component system phosphate regulon sensor histidine kinase PhoR
MERACGRELFRFGLLLLAALIVGAILDEKAVVLALTLLAYACWQFYWLYRLGHWLAHERRAPPPEAPGAWGEVFHLLYQRYRRYQKRKKRIARLLRAFSNSTAAMPDGTIVLNAQWQILWFNDAASRLLGLTRHQDAGQHITNLIRSPAFVHYLGAENFREAVEIASPLDRERRVSLRIVPYGDGERLLLARDITRLHRLEQMRREFVANASHELRSPLTVIAGYLDALDETLVQDERLPREWDKPVGEMRRQAERMSATITDLLELSRLETAPDPDNNEEIHVKGMVTRIRDEALALGEGPGDVTLEFRTDARLFGVEREIHSAFSNLVFNAMRYTPADGRVVLRWALRGDEPCLSVIDTGIGIPKDQIPRITERFYRVDPSRVRTTGGTGLGLAIVKHVLQRHGGRLEIESAPGEGSTFSCIFPAHRAVAAAA